MKQEVKALVVAFLTVCFLHVGMYLYQVETGHVWVPKERIAQLEFRLRTAESRTNLTSLVSQLNDYITQNNARLATLESKKKK